MILKISRLQPFSLYISAAHWLPHNGHTCISRGNWEYYFSRKLAIDIIYIYTESSLTRADRRLESTRLKLFFALTYRCKLSFSTRVHFCKCICIYAFLCRQFFILPHRFPVQDESVRTCERDFFLRCFTRVLLESFMHHSTMILKL